VSYLPCAMCVGVLIVLPSFMSSYIRDILTKVLIFGIFAMSLNLLYGYTGLWSLGHAAYFGVAGYTVGILTVRYGIESFWVVGPIGIFMATLLAAIFGIIALRVSKVYFVFITLALGALLSSTAMKWRAMTGGDNGLAGVPYPDLGLSWLSMNSTCFYYLVFIALVICSFLLYRIIRSPFGYSLQGIRDDESRMRCLGYNVWLHKYIAFIIGGLFAGVAGVLFAYYSGILVPMYLGMDTSLYVMLIVIIGSTDVVFGPIIGAGIVVFLEHIASIYAPERWPMVLGGVFILTVMCFRQGIGIYLFRLWSKVRGRYGTNIEN
jgi:branched-chain amino acid transport system permease protein